MGRSHKRYNSKGRNSSGNSAPPVIDEKDIVQLDLDVKEEQYDASNALVLPSKKKKQKVEGSKIQHKKEKKPLSKKERKRLEKILKKKKKKINSAELLDKLCQVQATPSELEHLTSTSMMQTCGLKRYSSAVKMGEKGKGTKISSVKGAKRKRCEDPPQDEIKQDDDVQGNESTSSSDDDSDVEDTVDEMKNSQLPLEDISVASCESVEENTVEKAQLCDKTVCEQQSVAAEVPKLETPVVAAEKKSDPAVFILVNRIPEIQASREKLPIYSEEQTIMEAIRENPVVVIHGATGSGKTTQVPQFLYEAGYTKSGKMIGITEPRRIAAISMALRVGEELNLPEIVSYHIRYERTVSKQTEIKFMTDGVLLKEIRHDFLLSKYSVIVIDEAHERAIFSDVLIGLLSRILNLRQKKGDPLKVVIMSATLRVEDFTENRHLFKKKPLLIEVPSRQYDVVLHFNKKTPDDYIEAAYKKVCKIHRQLPAGGILVFVTGEQEVNNLCKKLRNTFPFPEKDKKDKKKSMNQPKTQERKRMKLKEDESSLSELPVVDLDNYSAEPVVSKDGSNIVSDEAEHEAPKTESCQPLHVLPLYSVLSTKEQGKIFKPPPEGSRLCVVATNVAETSITIPGLKYVVDTGKTKTRVYDHTSSGISQFVITWTSKASANQRAGRAGRTEGGHCYRLYSSAVFDNDFPSFSLPDIQRMPVDDVLLQMKALGIDRVVNFPFPSPPDIEALKTAEQRLVMLGALQDLNKGQRYKDIKQWQFSAKITPLGKAMSRFPVSPRYAKMLLLAYQHDVISHVISLVSALTVPELFLSSPVVNENEGDESQEKRLWPGSKKIGAGSGKTLKLGDPMVMLRAIAVYSKTKRKAQFCSKYRIRQKAMMEINKMRFQLTKEMNQSFKDLNIPLPSDMSLEALVPSEEEIDKIRKILTVSLIDHVARKVPREELGEEKHKLKNAYRCLDTKEFIFIHPSSILFQAAPEFVIYQDIFHTSRYYMKGVTEIDPEWIPAFFPNYCDFSPPQETPEPWYEESTDRILCSMTSTFGRWNWEIPSAILEMPRGTVKYNWFCSFLLEGTILPFFKQFRKHLLSPPNNMLKSWANLVPRVKFLLNAVMLKEIDSKASLLEVWKENPQYLLQQYLEWLPEEKHADAVRKWLQMQNTDDCS